MLRDDQAVEDAIWVFEQDGWPDGMGQRLADDLEQAYCDHDRPESYVAMHLGEVIRNLEIILYPDENHATSPGTM